MYKEIYRARHSFYGDRMRNRKKSYGKGHLKFLIIAVSIMVFADKFLWNSTRPYIEEAREEAAIEITEDISYVDIEKPEPESEVIARKKPPIWKKNAVPFEAKPNQPRVIIVIDDLGVNRELSKEVLELAAPMTLAFLPYARRVDELVEQGRKNGHEIMVHMPMEPMNPDIDTGSIVLRTDQDADEFEVMLGLGLSAFDGYVGINNHMGSRLTQDKDAMARLMRELYKRGLLFLDSRTIATSVAADTAANYQVPYAVRNVFLDHDPALEAVRESLARVEKMALKYGQAIAIGHPKANTITALKEWLPTLKEKGIVLAPVSSTVITTFNDVAQSQVQSQVQPHQ